MQSMLGRADQVAITGGIAEGKSTVLRYLRELGFAVDSSDRFARTAFESDAVQSSLAAILGGEQPVSPEMLRAQIGDPTIRRKVNSLMHPVVWSAIQSSSARFVEVPLLIETCLQAHFDAVWVVTCGEQEQLRRLTQRLGDESTAEALIRTQLTSRAKIPFADRLIRTNQDESSVKRCVTLAVQ